MRLPISGDWVQPEFLFMSSTFNAPHSNGGAAPYPAAADPDVQRKLQELRAQMRESFGNIVMAMMALPLR
ncbi:MAG: hypothetical protein ABL901_05035 [Hyphomicrobiaceae bacterium]